MFYLLKPSDLSDILQYTHATWGEAQVYLYRAILDNAFSNILKNPMIGYVRPKILRDHRILTAGRHIIIYRSDHSTIFVSRILHTRMDITRQL